MKISELMGEIESSYHKYFPDSRIIVQNHKGLGNSIYIRCFLAGNDSELAGKIWDNDMFTIRFWIRGENKQEFPHDFTLDSNIDVFSIENQHKYYLIKPELAYMYAATCCMSFRKSEGNSDKILTSLDKFFNKLKNSILDDLKNNNIHSNYIELVKTKVQNG